MKVRLPAISRRAISGFLQAQTEPSCTGQHMTMLYQHVAHEWGADAACYSRSIHCDWQNPQLT
jgi:hypothetical protein